MNIKDTSKQSSYWSSRYQAQNTGWDIGYPSTPIKEYIDQLEDKQLKILIPGAGNAYEAEYIFQQGFTNIYVLDIAKEPLAAFAERNPDFPKHQLIHGNFFEHEGQYDLIIEQTFFCSFPPTADNRQYYAQKMHELLKPQGKLVGLWFSFPLKRDAEKPPFGGSKEEYLGYFDPLFEIVNLDKAHNSIPPRAGNELFGIFKKEN